MVTEALQLARVFLGAIILAAGIAKFFDRPDFERRLPAFGISRPGIARMVSFVLPAIESVTGLLLVAGVAVQEVSFVVCGLLISFTAFIMPVILRSAPVTCGCFGNIGEGKITWNTVWRNLALPGISSLGVLGLMPATPSSLLPSLIFGTTLALGLLVVAHYLHNARLVFLPLPLPRERSPIIWENGNRDMGTETRA